jgi:hypothetical protein
MYQETWWQMALLPVRIFFQGQDGNPQYFDGRLNPFLLFLPLMAFYGLGKDPRVIRNEKGIILAFVVLFFAIAFFRTDLRIRYLSPIIPPLVVLSVFGLKKTCGILDRFSSTGHRRTGAAILALMMIFLLWLNGDYVFRQYKYLRPFDFLKGKTTREEYIERYRPEYAAMAFINANLPRDVRIMFLFQGNRGYYCEREYVFDMIGNKSTLRQLVKHSGRPGEIWAGLKEMGITHLLINHDIFERWVKRNFSEEEQDLLNQFFKKYVKTMFFKSGYGLSGLQRQM